MTTPDEVLTFWIEDVGPKGWYRVDEEVDAQVRERFAADCEAAAGGAFMSWQTSADGTLAYIILTDQFPRNIWRQDGRSFATDPLALAAAKSGLSRAWDTHIDEPQRQFFYLPLMHSENQCDQARCVRLMKTRMPQTRTENLVHAKAHREVIRRFGRFPHRNAALGRSTTAAETAFLEDGGYPGVVESTRAEAA